jgi:hypothetical protein
MNVGFSPCGMLLEKLVREETFFRSLFSP